MRSAFEAIAARRNVFVTVDAMHEKAAVPTSPRANAAISAAIAEVAGHGARTIMSGAGHDGQAMAHLTDIGMIFVRCRGGISHNPAEHVSAADMGLAIEALIATIGRLAAAL